MGTTSVAQATPNQARPGPTPPFHIVSKPLERRDQSVPGSTAGWYYDPDDKAIYRYWDGEDWTDHCSDVYPIVPPEAASN